MKISKFRNCGYGKQIVSEAIGEIESEVETDVMILCCQEKNQGFYEKCGFDFGEEFKILVGDERNPIRNEGLVSLRFLSDRAKSSLPGEIVEPFYFSEDPW